VCIYMLSRVGDKRTPPTKRDGTHGCMHAGTSKSQRPTTPLNQHRIRTLDCIQSINARIDIDPKQTRGHGTGRGASCYGPYGYAVLECCASSSVNASSVSRHQTTGHRPRTTRGAFGIDRSIDPANACAKRIGSGINRCSRLKRLALFFGASLWSGGESKTARGMRSEEAKGRESDEATNVAGAGGSAQRRRVSAVVAGPHKVLLA
jgi:hypothetical protein